MISDHYYYHRLGEKNQIFYKKLYDGLINRQDSIVCFDADLSQDDLFEIYRFLYWDNPYFFYLSSNGFMVKRNELGLFTIYPQYLFSKEEIQELNEKITRNVQKLIMRANVGENDSDFVKVRKIHDLICQNVTYDDNVSTEDIVSKDDIYSHTILGVFLKKKAVCSGISKAYKYLMNALGIRSIVVTGKSDSNINSSSTNEHAWNIVKIGDINVYIDLTWDMCMTRNGNVRYDYFGINKQQLALDHILDYEDIPECTSTKYDFFVGNNLEVSNEDELKLCIDKGIQNVPASVVYRVKLQSDYDHLIVKGQELVFDRLYELQLNASVISDINEKQGIVHFEIS